MVLQKIYIGVQAHNFISVDQYSFRELKGWLVINDVSKIVMAIAKNLSKNFLKETFPLNQYVV